MKRLQILLLTFLLVFAVSGLSLVSAESDTTATPAGLSQFNDSPGNLSSSHPSIITEESAEQDESVEDEAVGSELTTDNSETVKPTEQITEENLPETPEHLSGPMNADLRGQHKAELAEAPHDPSLPAEPTKQETDPVESPESETSEPALSSRELITESEESSGTEAAMDADELSKLEGTANPALPEVSTPSVEAGTTAVKDSTTEPTASEQSTSVVDDNSAAVPAVKAPSAPARREDKNKTDGAVTETGAAEQFKTHTARNKPVTPTPKPDTVEVESTDDKAADNEYATSTPADQLTEHSGLLPKVGFILKEFGKWLSKLIGSVDTLL